MKFALARGIFSLAAGAALPMTAVVADTKTPRMHFVDTVSGKPFSKDPAVIRFEGRHWLHDSIPPCEGKSGRGWTTGQTWHLPVLPIECRKGRPVLAPEKLPRR